VHVWRAELELKATHQGQYPDNNLPEIAFLGRSNVGKSSLINTLINRKNLARTSSTPGKTRAIFFYRINENLYLVDLPGYGYAKVSKGERYSWGPLMENYLGSRGPLKICVHIVDIRHPPTDNDIMMSNWLQYFNKPFITVATKADKISKGKRKHHLEVLRRGLQLAEDSELISFSAAQKTGREEVWEKLIEKLD